LAGSASLTLVPTEFARVRCTYGDERDLDDSARHNDSFFLKLEGTIGAHGAHPL
jgi:hypothetical protein